MKYIWEIRERVAVFSDAEERLSGPLKQIEETTVNASSVSRCERELVVFLSIFSEDDKL